MQLHLPDGGLAVGRLTDDGEPVERLEQRAQAATDDRVVVDQHDREWFHCCRHAFMMGSAPGADLGESARVTRVNSRAGRVRRLLRRAGPGREAELSGADQRCRFLLG